MGARPIWRLTLSAKFSAFNTLSNFADNRASGTAMCSPYAVVRLARATTTMMTTAAPIARRDPEAVPAGSAGDQRAANEIYADLSKTKAHFGKKHSSLSAFRNDSLAWMQVAELSFDSFMMRMHTRA